MLKEWNKEVEGVHKSLYANQVAASFRNGVAQPFIPYYARRLGATAVELGWLTSLMNLFPNILQIPWARFSDKLGRRTPFIIVGSSLIALSYLMLIASSTPMLVILAVLFQSIAISAVIPAWSAMLGEKVPIATRGKSFGRINLWAGAAAIVGGLVATSLVLTGDPESSEVFHLPFIVAILAGLVAALVMFSLKERKEPAHFLKKKVTSKEIGYENEKKKDFRYFIEVQVFYNFFMSMIWPILYITTVDVLHASNLEITILTLCGSLSTVAIQSQVGKLMDRVGPVSLINISRFMLVFVPLVYGFANSIYYLYFLNILLGSAVAIINVAFAGYILDIAPSTHKGESFAIYNTAIGAVTFVGSLFGGYLATLFIGFWGLWFGLLGVYSISFFGRIAGALFSLRIKDPRHYPERMTDIARHYPERVIDTARQYPEKVVDAAHNLRERMKNVLMRLHFFKPH